jgi:hypothetical protein
MALNDGPPSQLNRDGPLSKLDRGGGHPASCGRSEIDRVKSELSLESEYHGRTMGVQAFG